MRVPWSPVRLRLPLPPRGRQRIAFRRFQLHRRQLRLVLRTAFILMILGFLILSHAIFLTLFPYHQAAEAYDITEISRHRSGCAVVDSLGQSLGRIFASNIDPVSMADLPPHLVRALIATEDAKFFRHRGTDLFAIVRAALVNLRGSRVAQGASTITQQLARGVYQLSERTFDRKLLELFLARRIERHYSKDEILEQYLNRIYFGNGCWGIGAAARDYFGKSVQQLTLEESALLVGIIKRPAGFSPYLNPSAARQARDRAIQRMEKLGFLTPEDASHFRATPIRLQPRSGHPEAVSYLFDQIEQEARQLLQDRNLPVEGFVVQTSADLPLQDRVRQILTSELSRLESSLDSFSGPSTPGTDPATEASDSLQAAVVLIENRTGRILASVGGRNYERSQFNRVVHARRPAGSSFLPFVYAAVFDDPSMGPRTLTLDTALDNRKVMIGGQSGVLGEWGAESDSSVYEGEIPAAYALLHAKNAATVRLGSRAGLEEVCTLARNAGIESDLRRYPSTFLGASEVSLLELTRAYTLFPNRGLKPPLASLVDSISQADGTLVYQRPPRTPVPLVSPVTAGQVSRILQVGLFTSPDSPSPDSRGLCSWDVAGKSGTVHDFSDAWFVGYSAEVTCGVWVGYDQPRALSPRGFGHTLALPIWVEIMNELAPPPPLPEVEPFDAHGPLFCGFPLASASGSPDCQCILHHPFSASVSTVVLQADSPRSSRNLPRPVRPQVPVLIGNDPYGSAWPASAHTP